MPKNVNFTNEAKVQIALSCKFVIEILNIWKQKLIFLSYFCM